VQPRDIAALHFQDLPDMPGSCLGRNPHSGRRVRRCERPSQLRRKGTVSAFGVELFPPLRVSRRATLAVAPGDFEEV